MADTEPLRLRFDAFELDETEARLTRDGRPIALAPKAFGVLCTLARQPGKLVAKDALLDAVWGHQHISESVLKTTISELRAALSDDAKQPRYIETASRRGYRFIGAMAAPPAPPARPVEGPPIIGRQVTLERLHRAWNDAVAGRRQVFWIAGEAGVGKTTLIDRFVAEAGAVVCAHGQCVEQFGAGEPYLPVLEALGTLCRNDASLVPMMRAVAPTWLLQLPWLSSEAERENLRRELAGTTRDRMLRELAELLDRYSLQQPLLLVTEDLHWSDHATVHLMDHIARRRGSGRLMWLATFRLAEVIAEEHPLKALRHELRMHRLCEEVVLDPFSEQEVSDYVESRFPGVDFPEAFVRRLHSHTDGLPLFLVNVIDDLTTQGVLEPSAADMPIGTFQVPENLAGVIEKQIARLPDELRTMLEAASVCGVEFRPGTVADALERDAGWVDQRCDELARLQRWLRPADVGRLPDGSLDARYTFRHALYRHVFHQRIGALTRARLHRRIALSLERSRESGVAVAAAELATHFEQSLDVPAALRYYAEAAHGALRHVAPTEAVNLTSHALELLKHIPESAARMELELPIVAARAAACTQLLGLASPESVAAYERAHALGTVLPPTGPRALEMTGLGWVLQIRGEFDRARAVAGRTFALADSRGDQVLYVCASNLMGSIEANQGNLIAGRRHMEEGLAVFSGLGERLGEFPNVVDTGVAMGARLGQALSHLGHPDQARTQMDAALARADALRQPFARMLALIFAGTLEVCFERIAHVQACAEALQQTLDDHSFVQGVGPALWMRGWVLAHGGQPDAGYTLIRQGYEVHARQSMWSNAASVLGHAAEVLILAGRWSEAQAQLDEALALAHRIDERLYLPDLHLFGARIALGQGRHEDGRRAMHAALDEARSQRALWFELKALVALCELDDAAQADFAELKDARARLQEGSDLALVTKADRLLRVPLR